MSKQITTDVSIELNFVEIMRETKRQHGTTGLIECIIDYCCENMDFSFEDELVAAIQKFKAENA
jgi:hypothetical protein